MPDTRRRAKTADPKSERVARRIPQTFECLPTPDELIHSGLPDELMIDWGGVPDGATASIYLPEVSADQMLATAKGLYGGQKMSRLDAHTVMVDATALTYLPMPSKPNARFAGLLTLVLPPGMKSGHRCTVTVRQISSSIGDATDRDVALAVGRTTGRKVIGVFQLNVKIQSARQLLGPEERSLGFFRWVLSTMEPGNRWLPVMERFVEEIALRVDGFGGNSNLIEPSPLGLVPTQEPDRGGWPDGSDHDRCDGKVIELMFDRFGDFEGFCLETLSGTRRVFISRERDLADLIRWVWQARIRITVFWRHFDPRVAERVVLHEPPAPGSDSWW
jgi:hypothetical protein